MVYGGQLQETESSKFVTTNHNYVLHKNCITLNSMKQMEPATICAHSMLKTLSNRHHCYLLYTMSLKVDPIHLSASHWSIFELNL